MLIYTVLISHVHDTYTLELMLHGSSLICCTYTRRRYTWWL